MVKTPIYLDNAASTRVHPDVVAFMFAYMSGEFGNASSTHQMGRRARVIVEQARRSVAKLLNAQPGQVFFTSGGTEANNAILFGCHHYLGRRHFISSKLEHPSVLKMLDFLQSNRQCEVQFVQHSPKGVVDLEHLEQLLQTNPGAVVSLMHANNETGNMLDMQVASTLCQKHGALFHSDTVQTAGKVSLDMELLQVDFASFSAHKFHGPQGVGAVFIRNRNGMKQFIHGGDQERTLRAGTENVAGIMGMAKALEIAVTDLLVVSAGIMELRNFLLEELPGAVPGVEFAGDVLGNALPAILNVVLPVKISPTLLLPKLDLHDICLSSGSACASGSSKPSAVLTAMGIEPELPNLRISLSRYNTMDDCRVLVSVLRKILEK